MDVNPFQSPELPGPADPLQPGYDPRQIGRATQVRIVAVLMIVHGALQCVVGICLLAFTLFFSGKFVDEINRQQQLNPNAQQASPESLGWIIQGMYGAFGSVVLVAGLLGIFAGIRNYSFRGRVLGIVSLVCGMTSILACGCLPFSLGLLIYGLIIYLGHDAEAAFRWQEARARGGVT